jgi:hypothetical protein
MVINMDFATHPETRLDSSNPGIARAMRLLSAAQRRSVAVAACEFAIKASALNEPIVEDAYCSLRADRRMSPSELERLDSLASELDDKYFILHQASSGHEEPSPDVLRAFAQARAAAALRLATQESPEAPLEAVYEASFATDDKAPLFAMIESLCTDYPR